MHRSFDSRFGTLAAMLVIGMFFFSCACVHIAQVKNTIPNTFFLLVPSPASVQGSSDPAGDEWPMFRGALNHTGVATTTPAPGAGPAWKYTTGNYVESSPAVVGGRLYVGSDDGKLYCLNATIGAPLWNYTTGNAVTSSPAVADDRVYVGSYDHNVYCLNAITGARLWYYTTGDMIYSSSPAIASGRVYVGSYDSNVYCLNATTGAWLWSYYTGGFQVTSSPAVVGGRVYVGSGDFKVYCLNATNGAFIWSYTSGGGIASSPAISINNSYLYVGGTGDHKLYCLNATTGAFIWSYLTGNQIRSSPAIAGERVYVGNWDNKLYCLNATTGAKLWSYTTGGSIYSSPAIAGGHVYVGSNDHNVYCLNATTGGFVWSYATGGVVYTSSPAIAYGHVFIGSGDYKVYCLPMILPPSAPRNLQATGGVGQVVFAWQIPLGNGGTPVTGYKIYRGTSAGGETFITTIGNATTWTDTGIANGQIYYYKVSAVSSAWEGALSNEASATPFNVPSAPCDLVVSPGNGQIILAWWVPSSNGGAAITNYTIYRGTSAGGETLLTTIGNMTTWTDTSVANGQPFYYKVSASNAIGEGAMSGEVNATPSTSITLPSAPRNLQANAGNSQVALSWQVPVDSGGSTIIFYNIFRGTVSSGEVLVATLDNVTTWTNTGLLNGQTYYYEATAVNGAGEGPRSSETGATPATVPAAPQAFAATAGNGQVVLTWTVPASNGGSAITSYRVYKGTTAGSEILNAIIGNVTTITITGLTNGQIYYFKVAAMNAMGTGTNSSETSAIPASIPSTPRSLTATPGNLQVVLNWAAPASNGGSSITGYRIYQGTTPGGEVMLATIGNVTTYTSTGLTNGQVYYFLVAAVNSIGTGANSTETSATPAMVPSAPTGLTATLGNTEVMLNWAVPSSNGGSAITGYKIYHGMVAGGEILAATIGNVTTYTSTGLTNGQIYYFKVAAVNAMGVGANSTEANATPATVPTAPQSLTATAGNAQVLLNWAAPASNDGSAITGYRIYQGIVPGGETLLTMIGNTTTYTAMGLTNGQVYYFQVAAINVMGTGANSTEANATPATVPAAPQSLSATAGNNRVLLTWTSPASNGGTVITGYRIYQGVTPGIEVLLTTIGNTTTYNATSLTNGQVYYFIIQAMNAMGNSANSTEASATPATVPGAPRSLTATPGSMQVILSWTSPANNGGLAITGYCIYQGMTPGGTTLLATIGNATIYTATGLTNGQVYYFKVAAINGVGTGTNSTDASATPATVPTAPRSLVATVDNGQIVLAWTVPANNGGSAITGYKIYRGTTPGGEAVYATIGNETTFTDTNVTSDLMYYYTVSAVNGAGTGETSAEVTVTLSSPIPPTLYWVIIVPIAGIAIAAGIVIAGKVKKSKRL